MSIELSADLETTLRREAAARGIPVDELLHEALSVYRRQKNGGPSGVRRVPRTDRSAEMSWIAQPDPRFVGNWVVLDGDRVLASGPTAKAVYDQAKLKGIEAPFIAYVSPHRDQPFAGGWLD